MFYRLYSPLNCNHLPKKRWSKILDILSWEPIYLGHIVPQIFPHQKNILGVKLSPQFQVLPPENSHKRPCSVSLYIRHFLSSNPHALSLYEKKIYMNHNLHIKTNSVLQFSSHLFGKLTQVMKRSLNHKKKRLGNFQVIFGKTTNDLEFSFCHLSKRKDLGDFTLHCGFRPLANKNHSIN